MYNKVIIFGVKLIGHYIIEINLIRFLFTFNVSVRKFYIACVVYLCV